MLDPADGCSASTKALNVWVAIKSLGTPTAAQIATHLTATLSFEIDDNLADISPDYVTAGLSFLTSRSLITLAGSDYSIPDPSRYLRRVDDDLELVPETTAFRNGYHW